MIKDTRAQQRVTFIINNYKYNSSEFIIPAVGRLWLPSNIANCHVNIECGVAGASFKGMWLNQSELIIGFVEFVVFGYTTGKQWIYTVEVIIIEPHVKFPSAVEWKEQKE